MEENYLKGRGSQFNPKNKFLKGERVIEHMEGIDEEITSDINTQYLEDFPKKIVNEVMSPDVGMMYSLNPYQGCEHGCIYCYARNAHEYWGFSAGLDFERKIIVKKNAPELLKKLFESKKWEPHPISISGNTDCYQPAERKFRITRQLLEIALEYRHPIGMITKNALILRDKDILQEMAKLRLIKVFVSITSLNPDLRRVMEPRTVTAEQRLKVIETLTSVGVPMGVMTAPIIPGLNDHEIPNLIEAAAQHGALGAGYTIVRLNGAIGSIFTDWIHKNFPDRAERVLHLIESCHGGKLNDSRWGTRTRGEGNIADIINQMFKLAVRKHFTDKTFPEYDLSLFRRRYPQQQTLF
jgi:DNA repair photolyase